MEKVYIILGSCRSWRRGCGLDGQVSFFCCFFLPLNVYFYSSGDFPMINWLKKKKGQRGNKILSPGITSSSAPGFCLEGDMARGMHLQIPVQYLLVWSHNQRFRRNTIWNWWQEVWINFMLLHLSQLAEFVKIFVCHVSAQEKQLQQVRVWLGGSSREGVEKVASPLGISLLSLPALTYWIHWWSGQGGKGKSWTWTQPCGLSFIRVTAAFLSVQPANRWHWL